MCSRFILLLVEVFLNWGGFPKHLSIFGVVDEVLGGHLASFKKLRVLGVELLDVLEHACLVGKYLLAVDDHAFVLDWFAL